MAQYNSLLEANSSRKLTENEQLELSKMRQESDLFMLKKAQAAALLNWRGYKVHCKHFLRTAAQTAISCQLSATRLSHIGKRLN